MGYTEETHNTHADGVTILDQMFADEGDTTEMVRLARERHRLARDARRQATIERRSR